MQYLGATEAARRLGISLDTLRRWDRAGKISVERDAGNRRVVALSRRARILPSRSQRRSVSRLMPSARAASLAV